MGGCTARRGGTINPRGSQRTRPRRGTIPERQRRNVERNEPRVADVQMSSSSSTDVPSDTASISIDGTVAAIPTGILARRSGGGVSTSSRKRELASEERKVNNSEDRNRNTHHVLQPPSKQRRRDGMAGTSLCPMSGAQAGSGVVDDGDESMPPADTTAGHELSTMPSSDPPPTPAQSPLVVPEENRDSFLGNCVDPIVIDSPPTFALQRRDRRMSRPSQPVPADVHQQDTGLAPPAIRMPSRSSPVLNTADTPTSLARGLSSVAATSESGGTVPDPSPDEKGMRATQSEPPAAPEDCAVCFESLGDKETARPDTCQHRFCSDCLTTWATKTNLCPLCKQEFSFIVKDGTGQRHPVTSRSLRGDESDSDDDSGDSDSEEEIDVVSEADGPCQGCGHEITQEFWRCWDCQEIWCVTCLAALEALPHDTQSNSADCICGGELIRTEIGHAPMYDGDPQVAEIMLFPQPGWHSARWVLPHLPLHSRLRSLFETDATLGDLMDYPRQERRRAHVRRSGYPRSGVWGTSHADLRETGRRSQARHRMHDPSSARRPRRWPGQSPDLQEYATDEDTMVPSPNHIQDNHSLGSTGREDQRLSRRSYDGARGRRAAAPTAPRGRRRRSPAMEEPNEERAEHRLPSALSEITSGRPGGRRLRRPGTRSRPLLEPETPLPQMETSSWVIRSGRRPIQAPVPQRVSDTNAQEPLLDRLRSRPPAQGQRLARLSLESLNALACPHEGQTEHPRNRAQSQLDGGSNESWTALSPPGFSSPPSQRDETAAYNLRRNARREEPSRAPAQTGGVRSEPRAQRENTQPRRTTARCSRGPSNKRT